MKIKLCAIGRSEGAIFLEEMLRSLNVKKGDYLFATMTPDGLMLTPFDPNVPEQAQIGFQTLRKHREKLRKISE